MERNSIHKGIDATYTTFENDGRRFMQVDSYGSELRQIPGKKSQSIQLDESSAKQLWGIIGKHFGFS